MIFKMQTARLLIDADMDEANGFISTVPSTRVVSTRLFELMVDIDPENRVQEDGRIGGQVCEYRVIHAS